MASGDIKILKENAGGTYDETTLADNVKHAHLAGELKFRVAVSAADIDWSAGGVFTKTLSGNTTFTFSNLQLNKIITLVVSGNYTITLPSSCKRISGTYSGSGSNYIQFHCTNTTSGSEEVWYVINQEVT